MRDINISLNKPCFCNSGKKFKLCHGLEKNSEVLQANKLHLILKEVYSKILLHVKKTYDIDSFLDDFKTYNNIKEENMSKFMGSFLFIDFLVFRAQIEVDNKDFLYFYIIDNLGLSDVELEFISNLRKSNFSLYKVLDCDSSNGFLELENIFTKDKFQLNDKILTSNIHKGGIVYGRVFSCFDGYWMLPTFNFKSSDDKLLDDLEKVVEGFENRFENIKKEDESITDILSFVNSVEYEIYGGENPYQVYEFDDRLKKFLEENPDKDEDDFLDLYEEELLGLK